MDKKYFKQLIKHYNENRIASTKNKNIIYMYFDSECKMVTMTIKNKFIQ